VDQRQAKITVDFGSLGIELDGLQKLSDGFIIVTLLTERDSQTAMGIGELGVNFYRPAVLSNGGLGLAPPIKRRAEVAMYFGESSPNSMAFRKSVTPSG
jgi:hypothetical protein